MQNAPIKKNNVIVNIHHCSAGIFTIVIAQHRRCPLSKFLLPVINTTKFSASYGIKNQYIMEYMPSRPTAVHNDMTTGNVIYMVAYQYIFFLFS